MEECMIDTTYCYLEDTMGENWENKYSLSNFKDPDTYSKRLHKDLLHIWGTLPAGRYSPDFIGANRTQAHYIGLEDAEIVKYLKRQRTIGGHMLFPVLPYVSINQARGRNMLDRFDFTLAELRAYFLYLYEEKGKSVYEKKYSVQLGNSFEKNRVWIESFCKKKNNGMEAFKAFIEYFLLDMFVDHENEYKVFSLVHADLRNKEKKHNEKEYIETEDMENVEPYFPGFTEACRMVHVPTIKKHFESMEETKKKEIREAYRHYIQNISYAIEQRNEAIKKKPESACR